MWPPVQNGTSAALRYGNLLLRSDNLKRDDDASLKINQWGLFWICVGVLTFFFTLGALLFCCCPDNRVASGFLRARRQESSPRRLDAAAGQRLGSEDDEMIQLGSAHVHLFSTRRRLLEAYNKPSVSLTLQASGKNAWVLNSEAKRYLKGFKMDDISFTKRPRA